MNIENPARLRSAAKSAMDNAMRSSDGADHADPHVIHHLSKAHDLIKSMIIEAGGSPE